MHDTTVRQRVAAALAGAQALLLDFNGTLSDDEELIAELIAEVGQDRFGVRVSRERYFAELVGHTEERMFRAIAARASGGVAGVDAAGVGAAGVGAAGEPGAGAPDADRDPDPDSDPRISAAVADFNRRYLDRIRVDRRIGPDAEAFVREARRRRLAIAVVTAASRTVVVPALSRLDLLDAVDVVIALEDVDRPKPEPDCYLQALDALGFAAEQALAFEDSRTGASAAIGASVRVVAVGSGAAGLADLTPDAVPALSAELFS